MNDEKQTPSQTRKQTPLFREEAIRHRTRALFGDVVLTAPLSTWVITGLLMTILAGLVAFSLLSTIQIDGDSIPFWRWVLGRTE